MEYLWVNYLPLLLHLYFILGSFHETCIKLGLTENDAEAEEALTQA